MRTAPRPNRRRAKQPSSPPPRATGWARTEVFLRDPRRRLSAALGLSFLAHVLFIVGPCAPLLLTPAGGPPWMEVELREITRKSPGKPSPPKVAPPPKPKPPEPPTPPKPEPKAPAPKKDARPLEDKGKTIVKQKPKPPEPKREDLSSRMAAALERLKARDDARPEEDDGARAAAAAAAEASYAQRVGAEVRGQWALHEELAERAQAEHLEAVVGVVIQQSGAVMKKWVANSSGNAAFDAAALRTVARASPFPPFDAGMKDPKLEVLLRFRAEDLL